MHTAEEISEGLGCLVTYQHTNCLTCPFNPHPGREWVYGCAKGQRDIVEEARKLLERVTPKPPFRWRPAPERGEGFPFCPNKECQRGLDEGEKYCEFCGQAVKWDG